MSQKPKKPIDSEQLNQRLLAAIVALNTTFILLAFVLYWYLGRS